jgi:FAD/FMN-containing dehydrogenase
MNMPTHTAMPHAPVRTPATSTTQPFHGIVDNEGRIVTNWGQHRSTRPAAYVEPISYADVQAVVRDAGRFPTPVNPVGSIASVTDTIVNDGGTMLCLRKLDEVLGLERDAKGRRVVRVQAGCRLKKLNTWLQAHGVEIPFQAEIGEATVGSVAVGDTKESSLDGAGYFSAHVVALTYVDDNGELRTLSDHGDGAAFHAFKCSFGLSGIVVECQLEVRPATLCKSDISLAMFKSPDELVNGIVQARGACDALLAIVFLHHLACFLDQRSMAGPGDMTPASSQPACDEFRVAKRLAIQHGFEGVEVPRPKGLVYSRADFVNEYWRPTADERRLDFQYYEHDLSRMSEVIEATYRFVKEFEQDTGYAPNGWATYFVNRPAKAQKPYGLYSDGPGVSFSFDPFSSNPAEPRWRRFAAEYNKLAIHKLGGRASPIQTQWLARGDVTIPRKLARPRFTTKYYEQFLD